MYVLVVLYDGTIWIYKERWIEISVLYYNLSFPLEQILILSGDRCCFFQARVWSQSSVDLKCVMSDREHLENPEVTMLQTFMQTFDKQSFFF